MQTTSFDRMRSKAAQARGEQDEEQERGIYLGYSDNFRENTVRRAGQAEQISSLINATEYPLIVCGDFNDPPGTFTYETHFSKYGTNNEEGSGLGLLLCQDFADQCHGISLDCMR